MDGDQTKDYLPGWIVFQEINGVSSELFSDVPNYQAGVENVLTTMKIKKVGTVYTFSIVRGGAETVVTTLNIPEFSSYSGVSLNAWAHYIPVDILADNFRVWDDTSAKSCNP